MTFDNNNYEIVDPDQFGNSDNIGIKMIAMERYRACAIEGSKEMGRGGVKTKIVRGQATQIDMPNQREVFTRCVKIMEIILSPDLRNLTSNKDDKDFVEVREELRENKEEIAEIEADFAEKFKTLKKSHDQNKDLDWNKNALELEDKFQVKMVELYMKRLEILSYQLSLRNYYEEGTY